MKSILYDTYLNNDTTEINILDDITNFISNIKYNKGNKVLLLGNIDNLGNKLKAKGIYVAILEDTFYESVCYSLVKNNNCDIVRGYLEQLPFSNESFDKVIILEHFNATTNSNVAICEIKRVLKKDGEVVIEDLSLKSMKVKMKNLKHKVCGEKNCYKYPKEIESLFLSCGFEGDLKEVSNDRYIYIGKVKAR